MIPTLRDAYPELHWSQASSTMRLPEKPGSYGGVAVSLRDGRVVLVTFRFDSSREVVRLILLDPECPLGPHVESLMRKRAPKSSSLSLDAEQQIVARLWRGALTISIEQTADDRISLTSSPQTMSPPASPAASFRRTSTASSMRRDSMMHDGRPGSRDTESGEGYTSVHRSIRCLHCQNMVEKEKASRARQEREALEEAAANEKERADKERMKKLRSRAKSAGIVASLGTIVADMADVAEYI